MLLFFRCTTFIGVCVEFVAAVAWLAELFTDPQQRERVLGYTQAFSSSAGLLVAVANGLCGELSRAASRRRFRAFLASAGGTIDPGTARSVALHADVRPDPRDSADPDPAVPAGVAGLAAEEEAGTLRRPSIAALFAPAFRRTTIVTTIMFACSYGAAFGAIQQMPQIVPGLPEVQQSGGGAAAGRRAPHDAEAWPPR